MLVPVDCFQHLQQEEDVLDLLGGLEGLRQGDVQQLVQGRVQDCSLLHRTGGPTPPEKAIVLLILRGWIAQSAQGLPNELRHLAPGGVSRQHEAQKD